MSTIDADPAEPRLCGRVAPTSRPKALRLSEYLDASAVDLPAATDRRTLATPALKRMYLNNKYGCCVISSRAHSLGLVSGASSGEPIQVADAEVERIYLGFSPRDRGCNIAQVLDYQQERGLLLGGKVRTIAGYLALDWTNKDLVRAAIYLFGTVTVGFGPVPSNWLRSPDGATWDEPAGPGGGGHDVCAIDYTEAGVVVSTWGGTRTWTWRAFTQGGRIDEAYVTLPPEWFDAAGLSPPGLDLESLRADLAKIGAGTIPPVAQVPPALDWSKMDA